MATAMTEQTDETTDEEQETAAASAVPEPITEPESMLEQAQRTVTLLEVYRALAHELASTEFVPKQLRNRPSAVLACILTGHEIGAGPMTSLQQIYITPDGKPGQQAELMRALVLEAGHDFRIPTKTHEQVVVRGRRREDRDDPDAWQEVTWTIDDAVRAGLCSKKDGKAWARSSGGKPMPWENYTRQLLTARATSELCRDLFADVIHGVKYTPEELGASVTVNEHGIIEVLHEEVHGETQGGSPAVVVDASPEDAWTVQLRWHALPEDAHDEFRGRWKQAKIPGAPWRFPADKLKLVEATLRGVEQQWKAQGRYDPEAGPAELMGNVVVPALLRLLPLPFAWTAPLAPVEPPSPPPHAAPSGPETPAATDTAPDAPGAARGGEAANAGSVGALPLDVPEADGRDATDALLSIPDEVRTASDDDKAEWAVAYVKAMKLGEVDDLLRKRYGRDTKGGPNDRRSRLVLLVLEHELGIEGAEAAADA